MEQTSVDISPVSGGEVTTPVAAPSSGSVETQPTGQTQPVEAQPPVSSGENVAAPSEDEFPDEQAFQQLPGEQRSSNWQRARARISELNTQNRELSERAAIAARYQEIGEPDQLQTDSSYVRDLFAYRRDEAGNEIIDQNTGLPVLTAQPFIERLQVESPDTFYTMMWEALNQPIDQSQTVGDWLLQQRYGLNPALLDTYKQIQSPSDAMRFTPQAVDPSELDYVPAELHEAYKSFDAEDRQHLQNLSIDDEQRFLARLSERKQYIENQKFIEETKAEKEQAKIQQQQQWEANIQTQTRSMIDEKQRQTVNAQLERLKTQYSPFGPEDAAGNDIVYNDILAAGDSIFQNPSIRQKAESAGNFYYQHQYYKATGNQALASRALAQADQIALELQREYAKAATTRLNFWNERLKGRIVAAQPQGQTPTTPQQQVTQPQSVTSQPRPSVSNGFGISEDRKRQIAEVLRNGRLGAA